jgi:hypothetical protein
MITAVLAAVAGLVLSGCSKNILLCPEYEKSYSK